MQHVQVTRMYSPGAWRHISEHLADILARQCTELGDAAGALRHATTLLGCIDSSPAAAQAGALVRWQEAVTAAGASEVSASSLASPRARVVC